MKIEKARSKLARVPSAVDSFLTGQLAPSTRRAYKNDLRQFFSFVGKKPLQEITPQDGIRFREELLRLGYRKSTINRKLTALRSLFDYLVATGILKLNPFHPKLVKSFKAPKQFAPSVLTREEIRALLRACELNRGPLGPLMGIRDKIIILLGLVELLRRSEVASLKIGDIKTREGYWVLELAQTKSGTLQYVRLRDDVKALIDQYLELLERAGADLDPYSPLLRSFSNHNFMGGLSDSAVDKIFRKRLRMAGIDPKRRELSFHSLRHTGITLAKQAGADITLLQLAARHSDPKTTMRYYHSDDWLKRSVIELIRI